MAKTLKNEPQQAEPEPSTNGDGYDPSIFLNLSDLEKHTRLAKATLCRMISSHQFPPPDVSVGRKIRLWRRSTVENWRS